jgi:hypothetical protein
MKVLSIQLRICKLNLIAFFLAVPALQAQSSAAHVEAAPDEQHLRSRLYGVRPGHSHFAVHPRAVPNLCPCAAFLPFFTYLTQ